MLSIDDKIAAFQKSITANLLSDGDFIEWSSVERELVSRAPEIQELQALVDEGSLDQPRLAAFLRSRPETYPLMLDLIAFKTSGSQVEKWGLPQMIEASSGRSNWVAAQLLHVGLGQVLEDGVPVKALMRVAEVYKDSYKRRFRSAGQLETRTRAILEAAISDASTRIASPIAINSSLITDMSLRRSLTYVLAVGNRPVAGVATVFQNQSGGRQQRDLSVIYPGLQERMDEVGMALILIADGQGLNEASERTLKALFEGVRYPMTLATAEGGALADALVEATSIEAPRTVDRVALEKIIGDGLKTRLEVRAEDLPAGPDQARLALAGYIERHQLLALELGAGGQSLGWVHSTWVERARKLKRGFVSGHAIALFAELIGDVVNQVGASDTSADLATPPVQPFKDRLHVSAGDSFLTPEAARTIAQRSIEKTPGSPIAVYLSGRRLDIDQIQVHRKGQVFLPTNVIVLGPEHLESMAQRRRQIAPFMDALLTQSDLTKVSPYILNNATPARMFYGREREAATVLQTISTNSVAILGSRRIGKTSLIRKLQEELSRARFQTYFGDCQTVRTWSDFADLARRKWGAELPADFRPSHLGDLVSQLGARGDGQVVLILDEIDQLLDWDTSYSSDSVPEAFFRACRSLSQESAAHFVFSGERRIASRLWDPHSPHWNFCREVQLTQLERADAVALLIDPLRAMNIEIRDASDFEAEAWARTSGHPQIVQFLGDLLIRSLDDRADRRNLTLGPDDLVATTETFDFAEHYLTTYWGQATKFEKAVSQIVARGATSSAEIIGHLAPQDAVPADGALPDALRMLELYGVLEERDGKFSLRATWFTQALTHFSN